MSDDQQTEYPAEYLAIAPAMKRGDVASVVKLVDWQSGIPGDTGTFSQTLLVQLRAIEALQPVPGPEITELLLRKYAEYDDFNRHEVVEAIAQRVRRPCDHQERDRRTGGLRSILGP